MTAPNPILDLCQTIAETLGPDWSTDPFFDQNWGCRLTRATDGLEITCNRGYPRDRLVIKTNGFDSVTEEHRVIFSYYSDAPSITVSATRDPKAIARDIRNRLLPEATDWWQKGMIGKQVAEEQYAQAQQLQARLLTFPGAATFKPTYTGGDTTVQGPNESWIASIKRRGLTFRSLTSDQMVALLEAYQKIKGEPSQ